MGNSGFIFFSKTVGKKFWEITGYILLDIKATTMTSKVFEINVFVPLNSFLLCSEVNSRPCDMFENILDIFE